MTRSTRPSSAPVGSIISRAMSFPSHAGTPSSRMRRRNERTNARRRSSAEESAVVPRSGG
jgi:hypothetical protein